jgi:hypothetical protein
MVDKSRLILDRNYRTDRVTFGVLYNPNDAFKNLNLHILELPWRDNRPGVSCIPADSFECVIGMYYGGDGPGGKPDYPAYEILHVPGRKHIKMHIANYPYELGGCLAPGLSRDPAVPMVKDSAIAFRQFMSYMAGIKRFRLEIRNV